MRFLRRAKERRLGRIQLQHALPRILLHENESSKIQGQEPSIKNKHKPKLINRKLEFLPLGEIVKPDMTHMARKSRRSSMILHLFLLLGPLGVHF